MAGSGWRDFITGEVVTEPFLQGYLQDQVVMVFASASARTTALSGVVAEGMVSYLSDTNLLYLYDGAAWVQIPATVNVRKNSAGTVFTQPRINFIEGTDIGLTVADDGSEIDVTVAFTGAASQPPANDSATVATSETTTSTTYTDLTTSGPAVTLTTGTKALVVVSALIDSPGSTSQLSYMSAAVSGSSTVAASDATCVAVRHTGSVAGVLRASSAYVVTGLTAGSNTFTAKYRVAGGTGTFADRNISVINMGS